MLAGNVAMVVTVLAGLNRSLELAKWPDHERRQAFWRIGALFVGWWLMAIGLSWFGAYQGSALRAPTIQYGLVLPMFAGLALYWR